MKPYLVAVCVFLAGCATSGMKSGTAYSLNATQRENIRLALAPQLIDPQSAMLVGDLVASQNAGGTVLVCGYVNGRTPAGGYSPRRLQFSAELQGDTVLTARLMVTEATPCSWGRPKA
jgi:hypothetical protein